MKDLKGNRIQCKKKTVLEAVVVQLQRDLEVQSKAAKDAADAATHPESNAETKWDTFGLESSYLAQGQQKRVTEIAGALRYFQQLCKADFSERQIIESNTLITLENDQQRLYFLLAASSGGLKVTVDHQTITVITTQTPIGRRLMAKEAGDFVEIPHKGEMTEHQILEIS